jgi:hypothetical protein
LKEVDADEYEDEIWLAYVEPQYENEYTRMMIAQQRPLAAVTVNEDVAKK